MKHTDWLILKYQWKRKQNKNHMMFASWLILGKPEEAGAPLLAKVLPTIHSNPIVYGC